MSPRAEARSDRGRRLPWVPEGRTVDLGAGRSIFVRDSGGHEDAPPLLLLHGWMATADLNFGFAYAELAEQFRVVAFDQAGHGRGVRTRRGFTIDSCADDAAAALDALHIDAAIAVGYSMGGPIALSFARRHGSRAAGLVLCATAGSFSRSPLHRATLAPLSPIIGAARILPDSPVRRALRRRIITSRANGMFADWIADQLVPSDLTTVTQAGIALGRFDALSWAGELDTPVVSVVTVDDELVKPEAQHALARTVGAEPVFEVTGGHTTCFEHPDRFTPVLVEASRAAADRARAGRPPSTH